MNIIAIYEFLITAISIVHYIHASCDNLPEGSSKSCPSVVVPLDANLHCYEIGCKLGLPCQTKEMKKKMCCMHSLHGNNVTCCLQQKVRTPCREGNSTNMIGTTTRTTTTIQPTTAEPVTQKPEKPVSGCSENKCKPNSPCKSESHKCSKSTEPPSLITDATEEKPATETTMEPPDGNDIYCLVTYLKNYQHCYEVGCKVGDPCRSSKFPNNTCCPHILGNLIVPCCLVHQEEPPPMVTQAPEIHHTTWSHTEKECIEQGCTIGQPCKTPGLEHLKCCKSNVNPGLTCCSKEEEHQPVTKSPTVSSCIEQGCTPGQPCKTPGLEHQKCCESKENQGLTCCSKEMEHQPVTKSPAVSGCIEQGCKIGQPCQTPGLEHQKCCESNLMQGLTCCSKNEDNLPVTNSPNERCPPEEIPQGFNCMEIGCTVGNQCETEGLEMQTCCPHTYHGSQVSCCLIRPIIIGSSEVGHHLPSVQLCPPRAIPQKYHCMEVGCSIGEKCATRGLEHQCCCPHTINNVGITCCLAKPSPPSPHTIPPPPPPPPSPPPPPTQPPTYERIGNCPANPIPIRGNFHCMEIGCEVGEPCTTEGCESSTCCFHEINSVTVTCCAIHVTSLISENAITQSPPSDKCVEIGCSEGYPCSTPGTEGETCCKAELHGKPTTCCFLRETTIPYPTTGFTPIETGTSASCPPVNIPEKCHCMEIGCELGARCTTLGLEQQVCCPHVSCGVEVSCCLAKPIEDSAELSMEQSNTQQRYRRDFHHSKITLRRIFGGKRNIFAESYM